MPDTKLYDILGVKRDASADELKSVCGQNMIIL